MIRRLLLARMTRTAYRGALFHLLGDPQKDGPGAVEAHEDGVLVVEDGHVAAAGAWDEIGPRLGGVAVEKLDGILVPGFIDIHVHFPQTGIIASPGARLLEWLANYTFPAEARFDHKDVALQAARFFLDQLLAHGTTSALVFATVHKVSAEALFEEALARNMRLVTGKVLMDRSAPPGICDTAETGYQQSRILIRQWHGKGRLGYAVTPRFALTSSADQLEMAGRLLAETPGVHLHTHLSENPEELAAVHRLFPDCPDYFSVYEKFGLATLPFGVRPWHPSLACRMVAPGQKRFQCRLLPHVQSVSRQRAVRSGGGGKCRRAASVWAPMSAAARRCRCSRP